MVLDSAAVEGMRISRTDALNFFQEHPDLLTELLNTNISPAEIAMVSRRKEQLKIFEKLLNDSDYFDRTRNELGANKRDEDVWQQFFESNTWIFGYGLNYFLNSPLDNEKFEKVVTGSNFDRGGKRIDALLKTKGFISSLSFGEIKTHRKVLLKEVSSPYRSESWQISDELSGGIAQVQKTVQMSLHTINTRTSITDNQGNPTNEELYLYQPKSFLIIGSLQEFIVEGGINEQKYSSFELFRKNITNPEIITFDELYERAKFIVTSEVEKNSPGEKIPPG